MAFVAHTYTIYSGGIFIDISNSKKKFSRTPKRCVVSNEKYLLQY